MNYEIKILYCNPTILSQITASCSDHKKEYKQVRNPEKEDIQQFKLKAVWWKRKTNRAEEITTLQNSLRRPQHSWCFSSYYPLSDFTMKFLSWPDVRFYFWKSIQGDEKADFHHKTGERVQADILLV